MKKLYYSVIVLMVMCLILPVACAEPSEAPTAPEEKPIKAVLTTAYPAGMHTELALHKLADLAKEKTDGRLIIDVHSAGELYSREEEMMALSTGAIQMMSTNIAALIPVFKGAIALFLPYLWPDFKTLRAFEATPEWQTAWEEGIEQKLGIKTLCYNPVGPGLSANKVRPILKYEDYEGLKMRAASTVEVALYNLIGATPVQIPVTELWTALEQGMVDGFSTTMAKFAVGPEADYGKYAGKDAAMFVEGWIFANAEWWDNLPPDIRQIMEEEVIPEVESYSNTEMEKVVEKCISSTAERGTVWDNIENLPELREKLAPLYKLLKSEIGNDALYDKALEVAGAK